VIFLPNINNKDRTWVRVRAGSSRWLALSLVPLLGCVSDQLITLGESPELPSASSSTGSSVVTLVVDSVRAITELNSVEKDDNPTLSQDELIVCFTSKRDGGTGGTDIWCAERSSVTEPFNSPRELSQINTDDFESSPALSADGLILWYSSEREDFGLDILVTQRDTRSADWGSGQLVSALNSSVDDLPRPLALGARVMPMASRRDSEDYWTYLASRTNSDEPFTEPQLIEELAVAGRSVVDGFLREDGLLLLYSMSEAPEPGDIQFSQREDLSARFSTPTPVVGLNTEADDRDPWLSADGKRLYFSSDRDGELDIFVAELRRP
jgi:hypothetical protein